MSIHISEGLGRSKPLVSMTSWTTPKLNPAQLLFQVPQQQVNKLAPKPAKTGARAEASQCPEDAPWHLKLKARVN